MITINKLQIPNVSILFLLALMINHQGESSIYLLLPHSIIHNLITNLLIGGFGKKFTKIREFFIQVTRKDVSHLLLIEGYG